MQKKEFIQRAAIAFMPPLSYNLDQSIGYAEALWDRLTKRGYGAPSPTGPRETVDWHKKLSAYQREWFDKFWLAFRHKKGRNQAAMVWHQLGEPSQAEYQQIIDAAAAEARLPREPGAVRKMAQGWLSERRFDDYTPAEQQKPKASDTAHKLRELAGDLAHMKKLQAANPNDAQARRIEQLQKQIGDLRGHQS